MGLLLETLQETAEVRLDSSRAFPALSICLGLWEKNDIGQGELGESFEGYPESGKGGRCSRGF